MRTSYLNPVLYNKMYACMQYKNALALRVTLETGLRIDDVLALRVQQLQKRTLWGKAEKTGKAFRKVISADLANRLREIQGKFFIFQHRLRENDHRTRQAVWKDVKKAANILELDGNIAPHSGRKTYAVELFRDSGLGTVQRELQHNDIQTTMLYAFADYLDGVAQSPRKKNKCSRPSECTDEPDQAPNEPRGVRLDGAFWESFANLVAEKTALLLLEKIKAASK